MTGRMLIGGRRMGRAAAVMAATEVARTIVLTGPVAGLEVGKAILLDGETYRVAGMGPSGAQLLLELVDRQQVLVEPTRAAPVFGGDRPYLKRKKGRS